MARDKPLPFLVRLLLFVIGGFCGVAIVVMAIFVPLFMVTNWSGGPNRTSGLTELLVAISLFVGGFGIPMVLFSKEARKRKSVLIVAGAVVAAVAWSWFSANVEAFGLIVLIGIAAIFGTVFYFAFRASSGKSAPPEWKDMP